MMKKLLLLSAYTLSTCAIYAQTITGDVVDETKQPIPYANVILYSLPDTTYVTGATTTEEGTFTLASQLPTQATLKVSFVGYESQYIAPQSGQTIVLHEAGVLMDEVVVKGNRPISKMTPSGMQTTVENTLLSEMGSGNEVLQRIPMVSGEDGEFEVFGSGAATIYINNREVRDPSEFDNLNASDIKNIEVISNPDARYDATVAAVIRIKTIRKQGDGFSFNARSSFYTGENQDYINQLNTNYRTGGLDIFANLYHSDITSCQWGDLYQTTQLDTLWTQESYIDGYTKTVRLNGTLGANYEINDNHYVGFRYDYKSTPQQNHDFVMTSELYADGSLYDSCYNNELSTYTTTPTQQLNLYYAGKIAQLSIDLNADYMGSGALSESLNREETTLNGASDINYSTNTDNELWATKLQLSYPIWLGELSIGSEYVDIAHRDESVSDLAGFTSTTDVLEQNLALFAQYQAATQYGNFSLGVRYEDASYNYLIDGVKDDEMSRSYGEWFPNASYSNQFGEVGVQLSYTSKVVRPSYSQLTSTLSYGNSLTIQTGNPFLSPTIQQQVSLAGVWRDVQTQVSYVHSTDAIVMWIDRYENDSKVSVINWHNIDEMHKFSAFVAYAPTIGIWHPQVSGGVQRYWMDYSIYGSDFDANVDIDKPIYFANFENTIELPCDFTINLDANYYSSGNAQAAYIYEGRFKLNAGVTKTFLNKALSVKLAMSDITNDNDVSILFSPQTELINAYRYDNREVSITVRYNFNPARSKYKGDSAGQEARSRF